MRDEALEQRESPSPPPVAPDETTQSTGLYEHPAWLYVLSVGTAGLYLMYWVYRVAKYTGAGSRYRSTPVWWAAGSLTGPICCAILYDATRRARMDARSAGLIPQLPVVGPALLYALLALADFLGPTRELWLPSILFLPIPFLWIQMERNRIESEAGLPVGVGSRSGLRWAGCLVGVPLVLWLAGSSDLPWMATLGERPSVGDRLTIAGSPVQVVLPSNRWRPVGPGYLGDEDSALELLGPDTSTWMVAYANRGSNLSIDQAVYSRRDLIASESTIHELQERRYFLEDSDLIPASLCRYEVGSQRMVLGLYIVLTVQTEDALVELIGYTASPVQYEEELRALVSQAAMAREDVPG